jgi:cytochrome c-type biogenesis protein CcmF
VESDVRMAPGETKNIAGLDFHFNGVAPAQGPNFRAEQGAIEISRNGQPIATLNPQKRQYTGNSPVQTKADIRPGLFGDVYVALGESLDDKGAWAVRIYVKPFVRWIWFGGLLMMLGGFVAATDRRFRLLAGNRESGIGNRQSQDARDSLVSPIPESRIPISDQP